MIIVRPAAVAGTFYPGDPRTLAATVDRLLVAAALDTDTDSEADADSGNIAPVAVIAPHAGYVYSGPVAASAYARIAPWKGTITRVVVIGPAHRAYVTGLALSSADAFATPLGEIPVDRVAHEVLLRHPGVGVDDHAHAAEHSLEVHLPFLQRALGDGWSLVPIVAGAADTGTVADALGAVWGADGTLVVVSSDLSHYHDTHTARRLDLATAAAIVSGDWEHLDGERACGAAPVRGALELARRHGETITLLDLRNSGDTAGPMSRVVGYGSFLVSAADGR